MKRLDVSLLSFILGTILSLFGIIVKVEDKINFGIVVLGVYFILASIVSNKKVKEFLKG